jgi:cyclopropane fatty-acyl-phospholipid synthase-like methyltransferase
MNRTQKYIELYHKHNSDSFENYEFHLKQQFEGIDFKNKRILEIGCGKGFLSLYIACFKDPLEIIALDEAEGEGSESNVLEIALESMTALDLTCMRIQKEDLLNYTNFSYFDIIISNNALHHVCEHGLLKHDIRARQKYIGIFEHIYQLLKPDGIMTIFDYSRKSIWRHLPSKRFKHIEWSMHPTKAEWLYVIKKAGFNIVRTKFATPHKFRKLPFLINSWSLYLYFPSFYITANKFEK